MAIPGNTTNIKTTNQGQSKEYIEDPSNIQRQSKENTRKLHNSMAIQGKDKEIQPKSNDNPMKTFGDSK